MISSSQVRVVTICWCALLSIVPLIIVPVPSTAFVVTPPFSPRRGGCALVIPTRDGGKRPRQPSIPLPSSVTTDDGNPTTATGTTTTATTTSTTTTTTQQSTTPDGTAATGNGDRRYDGNDIILYDGVCNFCNTWVDVLLRIDVRKRYRFASLQSRTGRNLLVAIGKEPDDISSVVLIEGRGTTTGDDGTTTTATTSPLTYYDKSRCVLRVVQKLGPIAGMASQAALRLVPASVRDSVYDTVAENRYNLMGKREQCRCSDPQFADRFILD